MRLFVRRPRRLPIFLVLPTELLCGRFSAFVIAQALKHQGISVPQEQLRTLLRQIPYKEWHGLRVLETQAADGTRATLIL